MNLENHHEPSQKPTPAPEGVIDPFPEFVHQYASGDTALNVSFKREDRADSVAQKTVMARQLELENKPQPTEGESASKPSIFQSFKDHLASLNPWSKTSGTMFAGLAVAELFMAATCPVPGGPLLHVAFAGLNSLFSYYYLSGMRDRTFRN